MEAQSYYDNEIVLRVFGYGYEYVIELKFDDGKEGYEYKVPMIKLPKMSPQEMDKLNMVILVPFKLLKLRDWVAVDKNNSNRKIMKKSPEKLKGFIEDDII